MNVDVADSIIRPAWAGPAIVEIYGIDAAVTVSELDAVGDAEVVY